jgi:hypothetical protein
MAGIRLARGLDRTSECAAVRGAEVTLIVAEARRRTIKERKGKPKKGKAGRGTY